MTDEQTATQEPVYTEQQHTEFNTARLERLQQIAVELSNLLKPSMSGNNSVDRAFSLAATKRDEMLLWAQVGLAHDVPKVEEKEASNEEVNSDQAA